MPERLSFCTAVKFRLHNLVKKYLKIPYRESYSQLGEDIVLQHMINHYLKKEKGFYVEIGSNHPIHYSNTFKLYLEGWQGICVDLNKRLIDKHREERKLDIQKCIAISNTEGTADVYEFESDLVTTIDPSYFETIKNTYIVVESENVVKKQTLQSLLEENKIFDVDLLAIDVEGHDFEVISSLDFDRVKPKLIVIEMHDFQISNPGKHPIYNLLKEKGYELIGYLVANGYFLNNKYS